MNPTPEASTFSVRLVCRATRLWCALSDSATSAHVARCAACQRHFASVSTLSSVLRHEAVATRAAIDSSVEPRILRAVRDARTAQTVAGNQPRNRKGKSWQFAAWAGIAAAAALVVTSILIQPQPTSVASIASVEVEPQSTAVSPEAALLVEAIQSWSEQWTETVLPSAGALATQNPLQQEMSSAYADARAALDFLALNFLPRVDLPAEEAAGRKSTG